MDHTSAPERPDIIAAIRGGDDSLGMEGEVDPATATLEQAVFWRNIYTEILAMEESVLERIQQLTNVPVVAAQAERFRSRLGFWEAACRRIDARLVAGPGNLPVVAG